MPAILLRDVDLIKKIFVDNFDCFSENDCKVNGESDPLMKVNPYFSTDIAEWKQKRKILSPVFTLNNVKLKMLVGNSEGLIALLLSDRTYCAGDE